MLQTPILLGSMFVQCVCFVKCECAVIQYICLYRDLLSMDHSVFVQLCVCILFEFIWMLFICCLIFVDRSQDLSFEFFVWYFINFTIIKIRFGGYTCLQSPLLKGQRQENLKLASSQGKVSKRLFPKRKNKRVGKIVQVVAHFPSKCCYCEIVDFGRSCVFLYCDLYIQAKSLVGGFNFLCSFS